MTENPQKLNVAPAMLELFRMELTTHTTALGERVDALRKDPELLPLLGEMSEITRSIGGIAKLNQIDLAVVLANALGGVLELIHDAGRPVSGDHMDTFSAAIDLFTQICALATIETQTQLFELETSVLKQKASLETLCVTQDSRPPLPKKVEETAAKQVTPNTPSRALDGFSKADNVMLGLFRSEVEGHVASLNEGLLSLEQNTSSAVDLEKLMRASHSIKGAARIVKLDDAVSLAHQMEDIFVAAQASDLALKPELIDCLLIGTDLLGQFGQLPQDAPEHSYQQLLGDTTNTVDCLGKILQGNIVEPPAVASSPKPDGEINVTSYKGPDRRGPESSDTTVKSAAEFVKVSAENLSKIVDLAGETLVKAKRLAPFSQQFGQLRAEQSSLESSFEKLSSAIRNDPQANHLRSGLDELGSLFKDHSRKFVSYSNQFEHYAFGFENLTNRLVESAVSSRMRPFADGIGSFPRMVRDLSRGLGKSIRLHTNGKATMVDRDVLEKLEAPMTHLIRNAIGHGIEDPATRRSKGKEEAGTITLDARHKDGYLYVTISDDGRGIDTEKLRSDVAEKQLVNARTSKELTEPELLEFLFLPGFSTTSSVTELSGRGVGLDVVQNMLQQVGGSIETTTALNEGTKFSLRLPITLSVARIILVEIAGDLYGVRLARVLRCLKVPFPEISVLENRMYLAEASENTALIGAREVLELEDANYPDVLSIVKIGDHRKSFGLIVDRFLGEYEVVLRALDNRLGRIPTISSASITEDGSIVLVLDVDDLFNSIEAKLEGGRLGVPWQKGEQDTAQKKSVLVIDDSITIRELERRLLEAAGYQVDVAVDGLDGWNALTLGRYDLVVSDVDMPRMNGLEFVKKVRVDDRYQNLPVVIVSYKDREDDRKQGLAVGATNYLTKSSFDDESFVETIRNLIGDPTP